MGVLARMSYKPTERSTAVEAMRAGSAGLKRLAMTRSQPHSNDDNGEERW